MVTTLLPIKKYDSKIFVVVKIQYGRATQQSWLFSDWPVYFAVIGDSKVKPIENKLTRNEYLMLLSFQKQVILVIKHFTF